LRPTQKRELVKLMFEEYRVSICRSCGLVDLCRSVWYYKPHGRDDTAIRERIKELAETRIHYGVYRIHTLLRREGWKDNFKRV